MAFGVIFDEDKDPTYRAVTPPCDVAFEANASYVPQSFRDTSCSYVDEAPPYKYREGELLQEAANYIASTYGQHYAGKDGVQALDLIFSAGHGEGFCIGDALKYLSRYGRKEGHNRKDLLKAIHYIVLAMYLLDNEREKPKEK